MTLLMSDAGKILRTFAILGAMYRERLEKARAKSPSWCPNCQKEMDKTEEWEGTDGAWSGNFACDTCGRSVNACIYPHDPVYCPPTEENIAMFPTLFNLVSVVLVKGKEVGKND